MAISLLKILDGPWENVRGYLRKDLDTIQATFNQFYAKNFPGGVISITSLSTGVGLPGNPNTSIQFNSGGIFGGDIHLTWSPSTGLTNNKHSATGANAVIDDLHFVYPAFYTGVVVNGNEELFTNLPNGVSWNVVGVSSYLQVTPSADTDATVTAFDNQITFNGTHAVSSSILGVTGSINHNGTGTIGGNGITAGLFGAVYKNSTGIVDGSITLATCGIHAEVQNFAGGSITYADHLHSGQAVGAYGTWNGVRVRSPNIASTTLAATGLLIEDLSAFTGAGTVQAINYKSGKFVVDALGNTTIAAGLNLTVDTPSLFIDGTNHRVGVGTITPSALFSVGSGSPLQVTTSGLTILTLNAAANTSADGLILQSTTPATNNNQQFSPRLRLTGQGWKTNAVAASQETDFIIENQPIQGTAFPISSLVFSSQVNGGGYLPALTLKLDTGNNATTLVGAGPFIYFQNGQNCSIDSTGSVFTVRSVVQVVTSGLVVVRARGLDGFTVLSGSGFGWSASSTNIGGGGNDTALYRNTAGVVEINNGTPGTFRDLQLRNLLASGLVTNYNNISTVGWGVPSIYGTGRSVGAVAAVASVATYTVGASDGSFIVSANVNVTTATLHSFTIECAYTDESNTPRVLTFSFQLLGGTSVSSITNAQGTVPYEGVPLHLRCKASTTITIRTQAAGTYTTVVYNVEGYITQIG